MATDNKMSTEITVKFAVKTELKHNSYAKINGCMVSYS